MSPVFLERVGFLKSFDNLCNNCQITKNVLCILIYKKEDELVRNWVHIFNE